MKHKANKSINQFKARLVAKSFTQHEDTDYEETFSLVERFALFREVLTMIS